MNVAVVSGRLFAFLAISLAAEMQTLALLEITRRCGFMYGDMQRHDSLKLIPANDHLFFNFLERLRLISSVDATIAAVVRGSLPELKKKTMIF